MRSSGGEGVTELMKRLREAPTRSGKPKRLELREPCQANDALLRGLAEADARIEHDVLACDAGARRDLERTGKESDHVGDDIDCRIRRVAIVHHDHRQPVFGHQWRHVGIALQDPRHR